jgi:hypothetical protein
MSGKCSVSRLSLLLSAAATTAAIATGIPASDAAARAAAPGGTYVGTLAGTHAFVAVLIGERGALRAYVYDATHRIAAWSEPGRAGTRLTAAAGASRIDVTSREDVRLEASVARGRVSGSVGFASGERHLFDAVQVAPPGGFYQILVGSGVTRYVGGSIMWTPGRTLGYLVPAPVVVMLARHAAS